MAITPRRFTRAIEHLVDGGNEQERIDRGRIGREHILESFATDSVVDQVLKVLFGDQEGSSLPSKVEFDGEIYQGFDLPSLMQFMTRKPNSRICAPLCGQESWRWFLTSELNARGISRNSLRRS